MNPGAATAKVLFGGVILSFLLLASGLVGYFATGGGDRLLQSGLVVLLATPFARIVVLAAEFARRREYAFVAIAAGVLLLLGVSIFVGLR